MHSSGGETHELGHAVEIVSIENTTSILQGLVTLFASTVQYNINPMMQAYITCFHPILLR